jgi:hypothetical protein
MGEHHALRLPCAAAGEEQHVEVVFGEPGCVVVEAEECVRRGEHRAHLREPGEERDGVDV